MTVDDYVRALVRGEFKFVTPRVAWERNGLEADGPLYVYEDHPVYLEEDGVLHCQDEEGNHHMINVSVYLPYLRGACAGQGSQVILASRNGAQQQR